MPEKEFGAHGLFDHTPSMIEDIFHFATKGLNKQELENEARSIWDVPLEVMWWYETTSGTAVIISFARDADYVDFKLHF